ncbi:hypothetical protein [Flavobacterium sp.]
MKVKEKMISPIALMGMASFFEKKDRKDSRKMVGMYKPSHSLL